MSTYDLYTTPVEAGTWDVPSTGAARFSWEYDDGRQRLLDLYQRGKDKQWDATKRIDWDLPVDTTNVMATSEELNPIYGSRQWEVLSEKERDELGLHLGSWLFSQFLHGEQGGSPAPIVDRCPTSPSFTPPPRPWTRPGTSSCTTGSSATRSACTTRSRRPGPAARGRAQRLPLGHALPRHAGADRGAGAGRVRGAPRSHRRRPGVAGARVYHAGRGPARGVRAAGPARLLRPLGCDSPGHPTDP